ncbi:MAG: YceI family protein [Novosphingobium sp.]
MRVLACTVLAAALFGTAVSGVEKPPPGRPDPSRVIAGTYAADPAHTMVGFRINHMGFADTFGLFGSITGTLTIDPAHLDQAQVAVRIPVRKIITTSEGLTGHLLMPGGSDGKPDYFGPKPADALFVSTKVTPAADGMSAAVTGNLTLNGATRPVTIAARFTGAGKGLLGSAVNVGFEGAAEIKRSDFGLVADMGLVGDTVELEISATFVRK